MKYLLVILLASVSAVSCAQPKLGVVKSYAFFKEFMPGTIPVDDNGVAMRPPADTVFLAFLETRGNVPIWSRAWVNGKTYNVINTKMGSTHRVGYKNNSDEAVTVAAKAGNKLMQINLEKTDPVPAPAAYRRQLGGNKILLEGSYNKKKVYLVISKPLHLRPDEHP